MTVEPALPSALSAVTLFADDLAAARSFYVDKLGLPVLFEDPESVALRFGGVIVNVLTASAAPELIEPARVAARDAGSRFVLSVPVDDADAACARLVERGVALLNGPVDRPWGVRTAAFADPAGHVWELAQQLS